MNPAQREARRYHWQSEGLLGYFDTPHTAIEGRNVGAIINLTDRLAEPNRQASLDLVLHGPDLPLAVLRRYSEPCPGTLDLFAADQPQDSHLTMPAHHDVRAADVDIKRLHTTLAAAADRGPKDFADLLLSPGVGARTVASLAFVAEMIHGAPYRFRDPARFSLAHGGKDGHPFPVPLKVYDETIGVLKRAIGNAKLGRHEALEAIRRLDVQARRVDEVVQGPSLADYIAVEQEHSTQYGGRCV